MGKNRNQTTTTNVDPRTQQIRDSVYGAAESAAGMRQPTQQEVGAWMQSSGFRVPADVGRRGPQAVSDYIMNAYRQANPQQGAQAPGLTAAGQGAQTFYEGALSGANRGIAAMTGDAGAAAQFMNPYQQQVIDQAMSGWDKINEGTMTAVNDAATRAGAFGGTRHGIATGTALARNNEAQALQRAQLLHGGFEGAMGRAAGVANLGFGAAGATPGFTDWSQIQTNPDLWRLAILQRGMQGMPYGQSTTTPQSRNVGAGILGGAATGSQFGPWGAVAGGILGAF